MGAAVARPGMDTRVWVSLATALDESFYDPAFGVFVDVVLIPSGESVSARVPADYAGVGFGLYTKIHKDDELVIVIPSGDTSEGPAVVKRLWNGVDTPPAEIQNAPDDVWLVVEKDKNFNLVTKGQGTVTLKSETKVVVDSPATEIGSVANNDGTLKVLDGSKSVAIAEHAQELYGDLKTYIEGAMVPTAFGPSGTVQAGSGPAPDWNSAIASTKITIPDG